jgi:hypothetical protein
MSRERIGQVEIANGVLVVADFGLFGAFEEEPDAARAAVMEAVLAKETSLEHEGVTLVAVGGIPRGQYWVWSESFESEEFEGLRRSITIEIAEGASARERTLGEVTVDRARLGVLDAGVLASWNESQPTDGKADIVFWGLHEQEVAKKFEAPKIDDDTFGFLNLPVREAIEIGKRLEALRGEGDLRFAFDFRPHSHPYFLLAQIRSNENEAGVIEVGNTSMCGFMTTWGDGVFPVILEESADGKPLRCTIVLATEQALANMRVVNENEEDLEDSDEEDEDDEPPVIN